LAVAVGILCLPSGALGDGAAATLSGVVRDGHGQPLAGVQLGLYPAGAGSGASTVSESNGHYLLAVSPGVYALSISSISGGPFLSTGGPATLELTSDRVQDLTVPLLTLTVRVRDAGGTPVANASVSLGLPMGVFAPGFELFPGYTTGSFYILGNSGSTNASGEVALRWLPTNAGAEAHVNPAAGSGLPNTTFTLDQITTDTTTTVVVPGGAQPTAPGAPTSATATAGNGQATVNFTPPASNGGAAITSYTVTSSPGGLTASGSGSPIVVSGLTNGTSYMFTVTATNVAGTGPPSPPSNAVTPRTVPGAPTGALAMPGDGQAAVNFSAPASNGGSPITSYTVTSSPGGLTASGSGSPIVVSGLTNGTSYTFTVTATNGAGTGPPSTPSNAVTPGLSLTVTVRASGVYGTAPNLAGLAAENAAISYSPAGEAGNVTGTLTCSTTAGSTSPVGSYPITGCSGLVAAGFSVVYDYADSDYTVTKAPLTVNANDTSRLFGAANPPLGATLAGFVLGQTLATSGVGGNAACTTTAMPFSTGGTYPITCTHGTLTAANYSFGPFVPGTLTVGYSQPPINGMRGGGLTVLAGQSIRLGPGAMISGGVTVQAGGALELDGATVSGGLRATGAAALRLCGASVSNGLTVTGTTGLVLIGGDAATGPCAGNVVTGAVLLTGNSGGVEFNSNRVSGGLTITGNTGSVPPPDTGPVHVTGNTVTGPRTIQS
jgi:hypothetical protein